MEHFAIDTVAEKSPDFRRVLVPGDLVAVPAGTRHNFVNSGPNPLVLYTVYSPPEHADGAVHRTKEEAEAKEEAGEDEPPTGT